MRKKASLVIPSFNGLDLLQKNLPALLRATDDNDEIIVVDDGSSDKTVSFLGDKLPRVKIVELKDNQGFSRAVNRGFEEAKNDTVILLNNDVEVTRNFIEPLLQCFDIEKDVFAVTSKILVPALDGIDEGLKTCFFSRGMFYVDTIQSNDEKMVPTLYATGCCAAYDKEKFIELGGFDELYSPYYWEDVDISYRAWKRGWKVLYQPKSVVYHQYQATISNKSKKEDIELIKIRNQFLFIWKNLTDPSLKIKHAFSLFLLKIPLAILRRDSIFLKAFKEALKKKLLALKKNKKEGQEAIVADKEIIEIFKHTAKR